MYVCMTWKQKYNCLGNRGRGARVGPQYRIWDALMRVCRALQTSGTSAHLAYGHREALWDHFKSKAADVNSNWDCWEGVRGVPVLASPTENSSGSPLPPSPLPATVWTKHRKSQSRPSRISATLSVLEEREFKGRVSAPETSQSPGPSTIFIAAVFLIARNWKQARCLSTDEWIKKTWYIYTMEYYPAI